MSDYIFTELRGILTIDGKGRIAKAAALRNLFESFKKFDVLPRLKAIEKGMEEFAMPEIYNPSDPEFIDQTGYEVIEFDGGTPCNSPGRGYGKGYGSYKIGSGPIVRCEFEPMSANAAELWTAIAALKAVSEQDRKSKKFLVRGDSTIALKWIKSAHRNEYAKLTKGSFHLFVLATEELYRIAPTFNSITTEWRRRNHSVRIFGH